MSLAIGAIDYAIDEVSRLRETTPNDVIDDTLFHLRQARNCLDQGAKEMSSIMCMLPFMIMLAKSRFPIRDQNLRASLNQD